MRRIVVVLGVMAVLTAIAALTASIALAQAQNDTVIDSYPFTGEAVNPCTGELYTIEGTAHMVSRVTIDNNGNTHNHFSLSAVGKGVGEFGGRYVIPGTLTNTDNGVPFDSSAAEQTITTSQRIIRLGDDGTKEDFLIHLTLHFTQNADGEYTAEVVKADIDCR